MKYVSFICENQSTQATILENEGLVNYSSGLIVDFNLHLENYIYTNLKSFIAEDLHSSYENIRNFIISENVEIMGDISNILSSNLVEEDKAQRALDYISGKVSSLETLNTESLGSLSHDFVRGMVNPFGKAVGDLASTTAHNANLNTGTAAIAHTVGWAHKGLHGVGRVTPHAIGGTLLAHQQNTIDDMERTNAYKDNIRNTGETGTIKNSNWHTIRTLTNRGKDAALDKIKTTIKDGANRL
jgi:hypothetical protein